MSSQQATCTKNAVLTSHVSIRSPRLLQIADGGGISYGAHQIWYRSWLGRMGGCGPTAAANLLWYLTATRPEICAPLLVGDGTIRADMQRLMEEVWKYVTPGMRGVDKASMLADGAVRFGADHGVSLKSRILEIPPAVRERPALAETQAFLENAFRQDLPVAFLNLSNGAVRSLDSWHWVTLIAVDSFLRVEMYDQGRRQTIDMALWLDTTKGGGALVALEPTISAMRKGEGIDEGYKK